MRKHPFLIFLLVIAILISATIAFLQSGYFAGAVKEVARRFLPKELGINLEFSELSLRMFPPGISVEKPKVEIAKKNIIGLPGTAQVEASRIDFIFLPLQMLSGNIKVNRVILHDALIDVSFVAVEAQPKVGIRKAIQWNELLKIRTDSLEAIDSKVVCHFDSAAPLEQVSFEASEISLSRGQNQKIHEYKTLANIKNLEIVSKSKMPKIDLATLNAVISSKGIHVEDLKVSNSAMNLGLKGEVSGDPFQFGTPQSAPAVKLEYHVGGDAEPWIKWIESELGSSIPAVYGRIELNGKASGELKKLEKTLETEFDLKAMNSTLNDWNIGEVSASGKISGWGPGAVLFVQGAKIEREQKARGSAFDSASGGTVIVKPFKMGLFDSSDIDATVSLDEAHIHWLAAPALKDVFPLDFRASGETVLHFVRADKEKKRDWSLRASLDLLVPKFVLDNQRYKTARALKKIIEASPISVKGGVLIDAQKLKFESVGLKMAGTNLEVNGKVGFDGSFDFTGTGPIQLDDLPGIAENKISGTGSLVAHIHGPKTRLLLDFDCDLKKASYLNLNFGDVRGRITLDEDPAILIFQGVNGLQHKTKFSVDGSVNLKTDQIELNADFSDGEIGDVNEIFSELTKDIWWFPRTLSGQTTGKIKVSGETDLKHLKVTGKFQGTGWDYYGEKFSEVLVSGGFNSGSYFVDQFHAVKRQGALDGVISLSAQNNLAWKLSTKNLIITDFDHLARLDIPLRGDLAVSSEGSGPLETVTSKTRVQLTRTAVRGQKIADSVVNLDSSDGRLNLKASLMAGQGLADLAYSFKPNAPSQISLKANRVDFTPLILLINPRLISDSVLEGVISGELNLKFKSGLAELGSGYFELTEYRLAKMGTEITLAAPIHENIKEGSFDLENGTFYTGRGDLSLRARGAAGEIDASLEGQVTLGLLEIFTPVVGSTTQAFDVDMKVVGKIRSPSVYGKATVQGASVRVSLFDSPFENVSGVFVLKQNVLSIQNIESSVGGGRVSAEGTIRLFADRVPSIDIGAIIAGAKVKVYPFQFLRVRGKLQIHGDELPYAIEGSVVSDSGLSTEKISDAQRQGGALQVTRFNPPSSLKNDIGVSKFLLNIDADSPGGILVKNEFFDTEVKGHVKVVNSIDTPRIVGSAEVVQGKMVFKDRVFLIQSGKLFFDNPSVINPKFALQAYTDVGSSRIQLLGNGRLDSIKLSFSSLPPMPESEILSLLTTGYTHDEVKKMRTTDSAVFDSGEAVSVVLHSTDFNRDLQNKTGFELKIDETDDTQLGTSMFRRKSDTDTVSTAPKIVIKRQLNEKVGLSLGSTVGIGNSTQREVNAEFKVSPGVSVIGVWDTLEGNENKDSYGIDLKVQKRFK